MTGQILLVEDDVVLGTVLGEVLRHSGHEVRIVRTLQDEGESIHSASAVILDVDTTAADRELGRLGLLRLCGEPLPIVLMGVQKLESLDQRLSPYFSHQQTTHLAWVQKPFRNDELLAAVRQVQEDCVSGQATGYTSQALWGKHDTSREGRNP